MSVLDVTRRPRHVRRGRAARAHHTGGAACTEVGAGCPGARPAAGRRPRPKGQGQGQGPRPRPKAKARHGHGHGHGTVRRARAWFFFLLRQVPKAGSLQMQRVDITGSRSLPLFWHGGNFPQTASDRDASAQAASPGHRQRMDAETGETHEPFWIWHGAHCFATSRARDRPRRRDPSTSPGQSGLAATIH